jgi:hypothetical protein
MRSSSTKASSTTSSSGGDPSTRSYDLKPGITLHMYTSSAPCGNATLKKFAKMSKEKFRDDLGPDEWPAEAHEPIHGSSIKLGQFALLVKKDSAPTTTTSSSTEEETKADIPKDESQPSSDKNKHKRPRMSPPQKGKPWPATVSDDWTPPGTTIVSMNKGSIHTCSDKICRWNYLGLQGSLLARFLETPLYISTLTVGRKLTGCICRRAVCCRLGPHGGGGSQSQQQQQQQQSSPTGTSYRTNHPAIMGTAVYMDETGVVETNSADVSGQDVRFHAPQAWAWWPSIQSESSGPTTSSSSSSSSSECIDGSTGYLMDDGDSQIPPRVSTESLVGLFLEAYHLLVVQKDAKEASVFTCSLANLLEMKKKLSPEHEKKKEEILTMHRVLRQWKRRTGAMVQVSATGS